MSSLSISQQPSFTFKNEICFINFVDMSYTQAEKIFHWRNHPEIRKWMDNQESIELEDHFEYIAQLGKQNQKFYWLVGDAGRPLGVVNLHLHMTRQSEWSFYLNPDYFDSDLGINLVYHTLNLFFQTMKIQQLQTFVKTDNRSAMRLHDLFDIHEDIMEERETQQGRTWFYRRSIGQQEWLERNWRLEDVKKRVL